MEKAAHILICFHDFNRGGTERIAIGMAKRWADQGRRVTILCGARMGGLEDTLDPRIEVVELSPPLPRSLTSRLRLGPAMAPYVERLAPDVIFLPGNFHFPLVPALAACADARRWWPRSRTRRCLQGWRECRCAGCSAAIATALTGLPR
jgi:hypothetical protein